VNNNKYPTTVGGKIMKNNEEEKIWTEEDIGMGGDLLSIARKAYEKFLLKRYGYVRRGIDNVEKLVHNQFNPSTSILKQILTELEREERPRLARKGQMRRTGRNQ
tara:strand:+ start:4294 stop:4608 length:315 start_codon:yes stop_codon:yes gene_type:complete